MTEAERAEQEARLLAAQSEIEAVLDRHSLTGVYLLGTQNQVAAASYFQPWTHIKDDPKDRDQMTVTDEPAARGTAIRVCVALVKAIDSMRAQLTQIVRVLKNLSDTDKHGTRPDPKTLD